MNGVHGSNLLRRIARNRWPIGAIVFGTALAGLWLAMKIQTLRAELEVAKKIGDLGGHAFFDEEADAKPPSRMFARLNGVAFYARSRVREADLALLRDISLRELFLGSVPIGDHGLYAIRDLTTLEGLELSNVPITDAGLRHLYGLTRLRWVEISETPVTPGGVEALKKALPKCNIRYAAKTETPSPG
jgi:hypothetical protein